MDTSTDSNEKNGKPHMLIAQTKLNEHEKVHIHIDEGILTKFIVLCIHNDRTCIYMNGLI